MVTLSVVCMFFFFFQAEDGIRDTSVTGVQTCALPIFAERARRAVGARSEGGAERVPALRVARFADPIGNARREADRRELRSEERRVGKECRSWWAEAHKKENTRRRGSRATASR